MQLWHYSNHISEKISNVIKEIQRFGKNSKTSLFCRWSVGIFLQCCCNVCKRGGHSVRHQYKSTRGVKKNHNPVCQRLGILEAYYQHQEFYEKLYLKLWFITYELKTYQWLEMRCQEAQHQIEFISTGEFIDSLNTTRTQISYFIFCHSNQQIYQPIKSL